MIYHITKKEVWEKEKGNDRFGQDELDRYGLIHSSTLEGILKIIGRYADDAASYLVLYIDEEAIRDQIRYEEKDPDHLFPHFYELIDIRHVKSVRPLDEYLDCICK